MMTKRFVLYNKLRIPTIFIGATTFQSVISLCASIVAMRWIDPALLGIWQTLLLVQSYLTIARIGIPNGMNRELPYFVGKGEESTVKELAETCLFTTVLTSLLGILVFSVLAVITFHKGVPWFVGCAALAVLTGTNFYQGYLFGIFRGMGHFKKLAMLRGLQAGTAVLIPFFVWLYGYWGLCMHAVGQVLFTTYLGHRWCPLRVKPKFTKKGFAKLFNSGFHLFVLASIMTLGKGVEKWVLLFRGGSELVGLFAPAAAVVTGMQLIPVSIRTYIYPRLSFHYGKSNDKRHLWHLTKISLLLMVVLGLLIAPIVWYGLPWLIKILIPRYIKGLEAARIAVATGMLMSLAASSDMLRSIKAWYWLYMYAALFLILKVVLTFSLSEFMEPLNGVALGSLAAVGISGVVVLMGARKISHNNV